MSINLTDPVFTEEAKAREHLEAVRWPNGPVCPHCGSVDKVYRLLGSEGQRHRPHERAPARAIRERALRARS